MQLDRWYTENRWNENFIYVRSRRVEFFNIILFGITEPNPRYEVTWSNGAPCYIAEFILEGRGTAVYNGVEYKISEGDFCLTQKGASPVSRSDSEYPYRKIWMQMTGKMMKHLCSMFGIEEGFMVKKIDVGRFFEEIRSILVKTGARTLLNDMRRISIIVTDLFSTVMQAETIGVSEENPSPAQRVKDLLEDSLCSDISLEDISEAVYLSVPHIIRIFRGEYGITPMKYLASRRVDQAKILLAETDLKISEISDLLRYSDSRHFAYVFRKSAGTTPGQYRERKRRGER